ncbi:MAG: putative 2-aminoethylphosphonate ABC transporter ATP-binding protein [Candidatus Competibacteraceae bacterium]|nr:putative 2-aminoethylphosphonate ABC transporter ATP-binding protein [Candidatus Competibacteraceae bacterium]
MPGESLRQIYLKVDNVVKKFGSFVALKDVNLEIYRGEFICFLGPSGCGKTTLLRAIAGLDIQTSGRIFQDGVDVSALPPSERDFGIVFQSYALFPNLTVRRNIAFGLENRKLSRAEVNRRVEELLETVGLREHGNKYPAQISGGQQQRVALARALATSPGLLLLDEPLSALDAKVRMRLRHEIKELQRRLGVTTILVTHDQEEALAMADRVVVMNHGCIAQVGTPQEIYSTPSSAFVADFIGSMNFLTGTRLEGQRVRLGELELHCEVDGHMLNSPVTVAIRPEDVMVDGAETGATNTFQVDIQDMEFLGAFFHAKLTEDRLGDNVLRANFSANLTRGMRLEKGQRLTVALPPEHIRVYARQV